VVCGHFQDKTFRHPTLYFRTDIVKVDVHALAPPALVVPNSAWLMKTVPVLSKPVFEGFADI
jgi:hypothetical protein